MLGHAGFLTAIRESGLSGMIDEVKGVEPDTGAISSLSKCGHLLAAELVSRQQPPACSCRYRRVQFWQVKCLLRHREMKAG
jgi:predicted molibdopterin-dependent oxidoreductase YjgC